MKKLLFILPLVALASCNLDNSESIKESRQYTAANFFVPEAEGAAPVVAMCQYSFTYLPNSNSAELFANNIKTGSSDISFGLSNVNCYYGYATTNGMEAAQFSGAQPVVISGSAKISDVNGIVTPFFYYYDCKFASVIGYGNDTPLLLMRYKIDGVGSVSTFPINAFYCGETTTEYAYKGEDKQFKNQDIIYRVAIDVTKNKATLIIYRGRFAEEMPSDKVPEALVLKDLDVTYNRTGYVIKGQDVIPEQADNSGLTPFERFKFDNIEIVSTLTEKNGDQDLSEITCNYSVAGMYQGHFTGSCYAKSKTNE